MTMKHQYRLIITLILLTPLFANDSNSSRNNYINKTNVESSSTFDGNNIICYTENNGQLVSQNVIEWKSGLSWPKEDPKSIVYASGLFVGGIVDGDTLVSAGWFSGDFASGPIKSNPDDPIHKIYKVNKSDLENPSLFDDFQNWPVEFGAPWNDNNSNGLYEPLPKGPDQPDFIGDQVLWMVMNDVVDSVEYALNSPPLGIELQRTIFGFNRTDAMGDMLFVKDIIINKSELTINDMYIGIWADSEIGFAGDDFVGCDTVLNMGIGYNSGDDEDFVDHGFVPALGYDLLQGPIVPSVGNRAYAFNNTIDNYKNLKMSSFVGVLKHQQQGPFHDTYNIVENYHLLMGLNNDGSEIDDKFTGGSAYTMPGDPTRNVDTNDAEIVDGDFWWPHDRRFMMNSGPFTMAPGDSQEVIYSIIIAKDGNWDDSYLKLKEVDLIAQNFYDNKFKIAGPPPEPNVTATALEDQIILKWDNLAESYLFQSVAEKNPITDDPTYYEFEGYNVYQLESLSGEGEIKRLATFDKVNGAKKISDTVFSPEYNKYVDIFVQFGRDSGVSHSFQITKDEINDKELLINREYYFAVTSYCYNKYGSPKTFESLKEIIAVRPQKPSTWESSNDTVQYDFDFDADHINGSGRGHVFVRIVDPTQITGDDYLLTFNDSLQIGNEKIEVLNWNLTNTTTGEILHNSNSLIDGIDLLTQNNLGYGAFPTTDGFRLIIHTTQPGMDPYRGYWNFSGDIWIWGIQGGWINDYNVNIVGHGYEFLGTSLTNELDYDDVTIEFAGCENCNDGMAIEEMIAQSKLDYPNRWSKAISQDLENNNQSLVDVPWVVYKTGSEPKEYLKSGIMENPSNGYWDFVTNPTSDRFIDEDAYEIILILNESYEADNAKYLNMEIDISGKNDQSPIMYVLTPKIRNNLPYLYAPFEIEINASRGGFSSEDVFSFSTNEYAGRTVKYNQRKINVWPNPYFGYNPEETNSGDRQIHFTNLPSSGKCAIRIFDLSGSIVRKINHTNGTQFEIWDAKDHNFKPVASGMYIVHIETESGNEILKLAVLQPK